MLRQAEGHRARERAPERKGERRSIGRESRRDGAIWKKGATGRWAAARRRDPAIRSWGRCDFGLWLVGDLVLALLNSKNF